MSKGIEALEEIRSEYIYYKFSDCEGSPSPEEISWFDTIEKELKALEIIKQECDMNILVSLMEINHRDEDDIKLLEDVLLDVKDDSVKEHKNLNLDGCRELKKPDVRLLELIRKHPEELGFICECKNYSEYVRTFLDADLELEDVAYTEEEFNFIKFNVFKGILNNECNS